MGIIDVLLVSARDTAGGPEGTIVSGLVDAAVDGGLTVEELQLVYAQGSNTVWLRFEENFLPTKKIAAETLHRDFLARGGGGQFWEPCVPARPAAGPGSHVHARRRRQV